jgi:hypothetical protein
MGLVSCGSGIGASRGRPAVATGVKETDETGEGQGKRGERQKRNGRDVIVFTLARRKVPAAGKFPVARWRLI